MDMYISDSSMSDNEGGRVAPTVVTSSEGCVGMTIIKVGYEFFCKIDGIYVPGVVVHVGMEEDENDNFVEVCKVKFASGLETSILTEQVKTLPRTDPGRARKDHEGISDDGDSSSLLTQDFEGVFLPRGGSAVGAAASTQATKPGWEPGFSSSSEDEPEEASKPKRKQSDHIQQRQGSSKRRTLRRHRKKQEVEHAGAGAEDSKRDHVKKGYVVFVQFGTRYYEGRVVSDRPEDVIDPKTKKCQPHWSVRFEDGDHQDYTTEEILSFPRDNPSLRLRKARDKKIAAGGSFEKAKLHLMYIPGNTEELVETALNAIGPPYGINQVQMYINNLRRDPKSHKPATQRFKPEIGMKVRKCRDGVQYFGEVTSEAELFADEYGHRIRRWEVTYTDGGQDDLDWQELLAAWADRPPPQNPLLGRKLFCLELFSGCGMVTQEFAFRGWLNRSIDLDPKSNATDKVDFSKFQLKDVEIVPDFIWASPPCFTYSTLSGGKHWDKEEFNPRTPEAQASSELLAKLQGIMVEARKKHPHMIVVIENPVGLLSKMPTMQTFEENFGLHKAEVHYCTLGRDDKKPTHLWTNSLGLANKLSKYRCKPGTCPHHAGVHPVSVRGHGNQFNAAAIPQALAELVARHVDSTFCLDGVQDFPAKAVVEDDIRNVPNQVAVPLDLQNDTVDQVSLTSGC